MRTRFTHRRGPRGSLALFGAVCALALAAPASALAAAGTVTFNNNGTYFSFTAGAATVNNVTVTTNATSVTIRDTGDVINTSAPGCAGSGTNTVVCTVMPGSAIDRNTYIPIDLEDLADTGRAFGPAGVSMSGEDGNDSLTGSDTNTSFESLDGGGGTDVIRALGGDDYGDGGAGDGDRVDLGAGDDQSYLEGADDGAGDVVEGGPGIDYLELDNSSSGPPFDAFAFNMATGALSRTTNPPLENDSVTGFEDVGADSDGANVITGTPGPNHIDTSDGNDVVNPGAGADAVDLSGGNDRADTRDGSQDRVQCGPGTDQVAADQFDELSGCEAVTRTQMRPAGADVVAPKCKITKVKSKYSATAFFKGISPRVTCDQAATLTAQLVVRVKRSAKIVTAKVGDLVLAEKSAKLGTGTRKLKLKASKRLGRKLGKKFKATIRIQAADEFGNRTTVSKRVSVKAKKKKRKKSRK